MFVWMKTDYYIFATNSVHFVLFFERVIFCNDIAWRPAYGCCNW